VFFGTTLEQAGIVGQPASSLPLHDFEQLVGLAAGSRAAPRPPAR
jgi:hypothetical protein